MSPSRSRLGLAREASRSVGSPESPVLKKFAGTSWLFMVFDGYLWLWMVLFMVFDGFYMVIDGYLLSIPPHCILLYPP